MTAVRLVPETPYRYRIDPEGGMRVPGLVFSSERLLAGIEDDESLTQVANVAHLPGIVTASFAMPDMHWGYGFPIGGVAATDVDAGGVISPGGVGFDISCGVRLHTAPMTREELGGDLEGIMDILDTSIPRGLGKGAVWDLRQERRFERVLTEGVRYAVGEGFGTERDLDRIEDRGALQTADLAHVSRRARERGIDQVGSLGSGNHFLEVQYVDAVYDRAVASGFGLEEGQVCVMIHTGSRGLGHQVCQDHVRGMTRAMKDLGLVVPDKQLSCVPVATDAGRAYLGAMGASANFGRVNRQLLGEAVRDAFGEVTGHRELPLTYDVSHNLAKLEDHHIGGHRRKVCVHRKGATLALPAGHPDLPEELRPHGQPVLIPGSMGTSSFVLVGVEDNPAFHSTAHGAGRTMSRKQAKRRRRGHEVRTDLEGRGIAVRPGSQRDLPEEADYAYKDVEAVVESCEGAGLSRRVARLRPLGVVKG